MIAARPCARLLVIGHGPLPGVIPAAARVDTLGFAALTADSYHPGGVNCLMGDGSVRFIKETINSWASYQQLPAASTVNPVLSKINSWFQSASPIARAMPSSSSACAA